MAIVIVGAGSTVFTRILVSDLMQDAATRDLELRLVDTNPTRLALAADLCRRLVAEGGNSGAQVTAYLDRRQALPGATYVINTILVGGRPGIEADLLIPAGYGITQTVGDTLGIGGISRGLRTIPEILRIARDIEELAPGALLLNYTNPMSMVVMALEAATSVRHFGLCHSIFNTAEELADYLDVPFADLVWEAAGVNHMAWFTRLEHQGQDLYPSLFALPVANPDLVARDGVRFELMRHFGYFCSESSKHTAEYFSYFLPHVGEKERLRIPVGRQRLEALDQQQADHDALAGRLDGAQPLLTEPSNEYAPALIAALESGRSYTFYPNLANYGADGVLIGNLPAEAAVEVPCAVRDGAVTVNRVPDLPPGPAALNRQAVAVHQLTVQAVLHHDLDLVYQAALVDPQVSAVLKPDQAVALVDELLAAHGPALPDLTRRRLIAVTPANTVNHASRKGNSP
jgi:alpha-galactosidase